MHKLLVAFAATLVVAVAVVASDIEYGHIRELKGCERLYIWTGDDKELKADIAGRLKEALPALTIVEKEDEAQIALAVKRRAAREDSVDPNLRFVTTGSVIRPLGPERVRLLLDIVSTKPEMPDAIAEITDRLVNELKTYNTKRYGHPTSRAPKDDKSFRSTAGLRAGLSKQQVIAAVGPPSRVSGKGTMMEVWTYELTDGSEIRIVFQGLSVMAVDFPPAKK